MNVELKLSEAIRALDACERRYKQVGSKRLSQGGARAIRAMELGALAGSIVALRDAIEQHNKEVKESLGESLG